MPEVRERLQKHLSGSYTLGRELTGGGMSRVFVADDPSLGRAVVVKVLPPDLAAGLNTQRFKREIMLAAQLQHPHIVPVLSAGIADDLPYFVMPFVAGQSLRQALGRADGLSIAETVPSCATSRARSRSRTSRASFTATSSLTTCCCRVDRPSSPTSVSRRQSRPPPLPRPAKR